MSNGVLRDEAGEELGTYHVACTITDEVDTAGSAWSLCSTAAVIDGRGALLASSITELLDVETAGYGFGVALDPFHITGEPRLSEPSETVTP